MDARDISSNGGEISENDYYDMLATRGGEKLAERQIVKAFSGNIEPQTTYQYKKDYNLGDIVSVDNGYGVTATPRIIEIIECWDDTGPIKSCRRLKNGRFEMAVTSGFLTQ